MSEIRDLDREREEHLQKYGSMLYCPERETLCFYMDGMWATGCERDGCILDDPEYQELQEVIRKNREDTFRRKIESERKAEESAREYAERERREKIIEERMKESRRIEAMSREAYRRNRPGRGDELFEKARSMRIELKKETGR